MPENLERNYTLCVLKPALILKRMHSQTLLLLVFLTCFHLSSQQMVSVNVEIETQNSTGLTENLGVVLTDANLSQATIQSITQEELVVEICKTGTFSSPDGGLCTNCPAGTASPVTGAINDMTCASCIAGTFASVASSTCTNCPTNSFSPTYKASSVAQCLSCPTDTSSTPGSNNVRSCVCDNGLFVSNNLVSAFDGIIASLGFDGAVSINLPHVIC
jgi:hypothetical protein